MCIRDRYETQILKDTFQYMIGEPLKLYPVWEEEKSSIRFEASLELSKHDPRREGNSIAESSVPRYIEVVSYRQIVKARLDAIEAGFDSLPKPCPRHVHPYGPGYMQTGGSNDDSYLMSYNSHSTRTTKANNLTSQPLRKIEISNPLMAQQRSSVADEEYMQTGGSNDDSHLMSDESQSIRTSKTNNLKSQPLRKIETSNLGMKQQGKSVVNRSVHSSALTHLPSCVPSALKGIDYDSVHIIAQSWRHELLSFPIHYCI